MLYDAGVDLKTAMLWMGHADQSMTMQIYTHLTETRRKEAENTLRNAEKSLFGSQNGSQNPCLFSRGPFYANLYIARFLFDYPYMAHQQG